MSTGDIRMILEMERQIKEQKERANLSFGCEPIFDDQPEELLEGTWRSAPLTEHQIVAWDHNNNYTTIDNNITMSDNHASVHLGTNSLRVNNTEITYEMIEQIPSVLDEIAELRERVQEMSNRLIKERVNSWYGSDLEEITGGTQQFRKAYQQEYQQEIPYDNPIQEDIDYFMTRINRARTFEEQQKMIRQLHSLVTTRQAYNNEYCNTELISNSLSAFGLDDVIKRVCSSDTSLGVSPRGYGLEHTAEEAEKAEDPFDDERLF